MTINKIYEINEKDVDSSFLEIAEDIKKGYTLTKLDFLPMEWNIHTCNMKPAIRIILHNRMADKA